ncbi:MAG TPA: hypothetical protein VMQ62_02020 [Dongiaceae bacterium]|nr:hypothetical protein [Dongiaceae bacterium]
MPAGAGDPCTPLAAHATLASPQDGDVYLRAGSAACDRIAVEVVGRGLDGAFTLAFDLHFPPDLLVYDGYAGGAFLEQGSPHMPPLYLVRVTAPGSVAVTMTRFAPDPAVGATGDAVIVTLRFRKAAVGIGTIDFDRAPASGTLEQVLGADGAARTARFGPGHGAALTVP